MFWTLNEISDRLLDVLMLIIMVIVALMVIIIGAFLLWSICREFSDIPYRLEMADGTVREDRNCTTSHRSHILTCRNSDYSLSSVTAWKEIK